MARKNPATNPAHLSKSLRPGAGALALPVLSACKPSRSVEESPIPIPKGNQPPSLNGGNKPSHVQPIAAGKATETWIEPWVWRPSGWPGQQLHLNVVENDNPGPAVGFGDPDTALFSYGGITPGPTVCMRDDETLFVKLRNLLGQDLGSTAVGPNPDPNELTPVLNRSDAPADLRADCCLGEHNSGLQAAHVTNLHTTAGTYTPAKIPTAPIATPCCCA